MADRYDVVVVGAGPAGATAAVRAAELGARVAVVEARRTGGVCVNSGCVPTRVLAKTARLIREVRDAGTYGIVTDEPRLAWGRTVTRVRAVVEDVQGSKRTAAVLRDADVDLVLEGRACFVDPHTVELEESGRRISGATFVLCVGGHSRVLPIPGVEHTTTAEAVLDLPGLPRRVAIVGSGNTGVQLTTIFNAFGSEVTLLETQPRILPASDHDIARVLAASFAAQGVRVVTAIGGVTRVDLADDGARRLTYTRDGAEQTVEADTVIMSVGWPANTEGLGLDAAGVETRGPFVPVDGYLRTNVPHVFVAGDANGQAMLVQAAQFEATAAATNAVLGARRSVPHALLPSGGFTDPDYASVGLTEAEARRRDPDCLVALVPYAEMERPIIDNRTVGFLKLIADRRRSLLLGAHATGEAAVEVIQAVTTAMAAGVDVATMAAVEFAYPTYTAIVGEAAARLLAEPASRTRRQG